ncbi:chorismate-binding protein [Lacinutrix sp. Bg11-31]|uniref:chorismate-binding protein n=1 Tax=Lacinutrix sp. Bg11-31 TaxID=2057808 RepID=UPI000C2FFDF2|nr:chorismate-binding protein [Lacinutrix sp. Bg11-31]AUC81257.1 isochorismate synthase [Lacinutrix sp. Bg11-31]
MQTDDFFEAAQDYFDDALPFVLYRKPNASIVKGVFQDNDTVYTSKDLTESGFVFSPFDSKKETVLIPTNQSSSAETNAVIPAKTGSHKEIKISNEVKDFHVSLVSKAINSIKNGAFKKVVISRVEEVKLSESNPIELFKRLLAQYKTAFVYCWYHPKIGLWLGATPETLLSVTGNRFTTMSLAGTQEFKGEENPKWEAKETEEQQLVTAYLVSNLESSVSSLNVANVETVKAGSLLHLRTRVSGVLNKNLKEVVDILHPTPAVCGLPKDVTKAFILETENYNREFYTGFLGELNIVEKKTRNTNRRNVENSAYAAIKTVSNLFVNLRCMQLTDVKASIYVGGGITKDSIPENEWQETVNKTQTMKKVLF